MCTIYVASPTSPMSIDTGGTSLKYAKWPDLESCLRAGKMSLLATAMPGKDAYLAVALWDVHERA